MRESNINKIASTLIFIGLLAGCVLPRPLPRNSRFAVDISQMEKEDFYHDTWVYRHPSKTVSDYSSFILEKVEVYPNPVKKISDESRFRYETLSKSIENKIESLIKKDFVLAQKSGSRVLELNVEIVDIKPIVHLQKDGNDVTVNDPNAIGSKLELDAMDSETGEHIFGISTLLKGIEFARFEDPGFIPVLESETNNWISFLEKRLKKKNSNSREP